MAGGAPFQTRIGRPLDRGKVGHPELRLTILQEVQRQALHRKVGVACQVGEGVCAGPEAVHEDQRQPDAEGTPRVTNLVDGDVEEVLAVPHR